MGKTYDEIDDRLRSFIEAQQMFFIATAPSSSRGLINLSPKGLDALRVTGPKSLAYLDLGGSGIETVAHLKDDGRFVLMFCAFEGKPLILRLYGRGRVHERGDEGYERLVALFPDLPGKRTVIELDVERIADSCGWAVPRYDFVEQRDTLVRYHEQRTEEKLQASLRRNQKSLDGLPGLRVSQG